MPIMQCRQGRSVRHAQRIAQLAFDVCPRARRRSSTPTATTRRISFRTACARFSVPLFFGLSVPLLSGLPVPLFFELSVPSFFGLSAPLYSSDYPYAFSPDYPYPYST